MAAEMTQTEPFPIWDVEAFEKYLQMMSDKGHAETVFSLNGSSFLPER